MIAKRVLYSGRVQGVGFRYTTQQLAENRPISGFVRNLSTGEVELFAEGETDEVIAFLDAVATRFARNIESVSISDEPVQGEQGFKIRH